jgi:hypothetical protein
VLPTPSVLTSLGRYKSAGRSQGGSARRARIKCGAPFAEATAARAHVDTSTGISSGPAETAVVSPFPKKGLWCPCPVCGQALAHTRYGRCCCAPCTYTAA